MSSAEVLSNLEMLVVLLLFLTLASITIVEKLVAKQLERELKRDKKRAR